MPQAAQADAIVLFGATGDLSRRMLLPWLLVVVVTIAFVAIAFRLRHEDGTPEPLPPLRLRTGAAAAAVATVLILVLSQIDSAGASGPSARRSPTASMPRPAASSSTRPTRRSTASSIGTT